MTSTPVAGVNHDIYRAEAQSGTQSLIVRAWGTSATVDDIRIGTEASDVTIPEPSSLALLGLGGLALARRRRG